MKIFLAFALALSFFLIFGCVQEPNFGNPPNAQPPEPVAPPVAPPETAGTEPPAQPVVIPVDKCAWALELKNFQAERNPVDAQGRAYRSCYNDNYILQVTAQTQVEFCQQISDPDFLVDCLKNLAKKSDNLGVCASAGTGTIYLKEILADVPAADACLYNYVVDFSTALSEGQEKAACQLISSQKLNAY
ncbi:MAG: hypothetical protein AABW85_01620, partial [archaeon]